MDNITGAQEALYQGHAQIKDSHADTALSATFPMAQAHALVAIAEELHELNETLGVFANVDASVRGLRVDIQS